MLMDIEINNRYIILHACVSSLLHKWTEEHQKAFEHLKKSISRETLLVYPDFNKPFEIHTDASKVQLGAVISQDNKPIAFYRRKLNPAQVMYTTTDRKICKRAQKHSFRSANKSIY